MGKTTDLEAVVNELCEVRKLLLKAWRARPSDMQLGKPATEAQINRAEKEAEIKFPPLYRRFLTICDGWYFRDDWSILGTGGKPTEKMLVDVRRRRKLYSQFLKHNALANERDPDEDVTDLKRREKHDKRVLYQSNHPIIGTNFNGGLLLLDRNRRHTDGEYEVVQVGYEQVERRYADFARLIQMLLKTAKADLEEYVS